MLNLVLFEMNAMLRRRLRNPLAPIIEGFFLGGLIILLEKVLEGPGGVGPARQMMFIASVLALPALQGLHRLLSEELASGTAEALFQVPAGPLKALFAKDVAAVISLSLAIPSMLALFAFTGRGLEPFHAEMLLPIFVMRSGLMGLGAILGSLAILFRRTGAIVNLTSILMVITSLGVGLGKGTLAWVASLTPHGLLAMALQKGKEPIIVLPGLALNSAIWLALGFLSYNLSVRWARKNGFLVNN